jgi:hypothetical protein
MTKRNDPRPTSATNQTGREVSLTDIAIGTQNEKKFSRWKTVEVELHELKDGKVQLYLIADGVPLALWTDAYQNLEMKKTHARDVKNRLEEEKHLVKVSISELKQFYSRVHLACTAKYISNFYYFLTAEGYYRAILEVKTSGMKDREAAAKIERRKDEMAAVFTLYKKGELIPAPVIDKIYEKRDLSTTLSKQVAHMVNEKIVPRYRKQGENPHLAFSKENREINTITAGEHEPDMKNLLNSSGLDIHIATKISDITLLEADVLEDNTRWTKLKKIVDGLYPNRMEKQLKLNEREMALIKRGCTKDQKSLFEFRASRHLSGGDRL